MGAERKRRTWWHVQHVELRVHVKVPAHNEDEARARA